MKRTLLYAAFSVVSLTGWSQCSPMIYPEPAFIKITSDTTITNAEGGYWICSGLQITINGSAGSAYYLEEDVNLLITATDGDQVFAKPGCSITNSSDGDINVTANFSTITVSNTGSGMTVQIQNCPNLTYDYTLIGGSGGPCAMSTASLNETNTALNILYPNPVNSGENVYFSQTGEAVTNAELFDLSGKHLHTLTVSNNSISTQGIPEGMYFLKLKTSEERVATLRLLIR